MKILFVAHSSRLSGANKSFVSIIEKLRFKIQIKVLVNSREGELNEKLDSIGVPYIYCKYNWWVAHSRKSTYKQVGRYIIDSFNYWNSFMNNKLIEELRENHFDCIYSNTSTIDIGARIAKTLEIPHVWHIREFGQEDFGFIPIRSIKYMQHSYSSAAKVIVISEALKRKYLNFVPENNIKVIYNGFCVEKEIAEPKDVDLKNRINVLISGQVTEAKGQNIAIEAIYQLFQEGYPIKLYIAGTVDYSYLNPILRKYPQNKEWLEILGNVQNMYLLRNNIDIELVCSRSEAFGRVTIEAMLHSIPVIGSNSGSTPELIKNGETGLLFDFENSEQLKKCILELVNKEDLYHKIVNNALNYAKHFSLDKTATEIYDVFNDVVK